MNEEKKKMTLKYVDDTLKSKTELNDKTYYMVSQKGFINNSYENSKQVAVHLILSMFTENNITEWSLPVSPVSIYSRFVFDVVKLNPKYDEVATVLKDLERLDLITIEWLSGKPFQMLSTFKFKQQLGKFPKSENWAYFRFYKKDYEILINNKLNGNDLFGLLGAYGSIATQINNVESKNPKVAIAAIDSNRHNFSHMFDLRGALNYETVSKLSKKINIGESTFKKYTRILNDLDIISKHEVQIATKDNKFKSRSIYCYAHENHYALNYIKAILLKGAGDDSNNLRIIDIIKPEQKSKNRMKKVIHYENGFEDIKKSSDIVGSSSEEEIIRYKNTTFDNYNTVENESTIESTHDIIINKSIVPEKMSEFINVLHSHSKVKMYKIDNVFDAWQQENYTEANKMLNEVFGDNKFSKHEIHLLNNIIELERNKPKEKRMSYYEKFGKPISSMTPDDIPIHSESFHQQSNINISPKKKLAHKGFGSTERVKKQMVVNS